MKFSRKLLLTIPLFLFKFTICDVTTGVSHKDTVEYYHDEVHKELGIYKWTYCPGEESSVSDKNGSYSKSFASDKNKGSISNKFSDTSHLGTYSGSSVEWDNFFDSKNYTFNIKIKKLKAEKYSKLKEKTCVKKRWETKPVGSDTQVNVRLKLKVPKGVWVVRFHEKKDKNIQPGQIKAYGLAEVKDENSQEDQDVNQKDPDVKWIHELDGNGRPVSFKEKSSYKSAKSITEDYHYFFVVPGETLTVEYRFKDTKTESNEINKGLEVMFVGYHSCVVDEGHINNVFSTSKVLKVINELQEVVETSSGSKEEKTRFHKGISYLACFGDENVVKAFMQKNDYVGGGINYAKVISEMRVKDISMNSQLMSSSSAIAYQKIPRMALFKHMYQYVVDLKRMCTPSSYDENKNKIRYTFDTVSDISKILFLKDEESFKKYFIHSLVKYHNELKMFIGELKEKKISALNKKESDKLKSLLSLASKFRVGLFTQAELLYSSLEFPYISTNRSKVADILLEVSETFRQWEDLNFKVLSYLSDEKEGAVIEGEVLNQISQAWDDAYFKGLQPIESKLDELREYFVTFYLDEDEQFDFFGNADLIVDYLDFLAKGLSENNVSNYFMVTEVNKYLDPVSYDELVKVKECLYESL